jgi:hypothetical protein
MNKEQYLEDLIEMIRELNVRNEKYHYLDSEYKCASLLEFLTKFLILKEIYKAINEKNNDKTRTKSKWSNIQREEFKNRWISKSEKE